MADLSAPSVGCVPLNRQSVAHQTNWHTSNLDPLDAQFILRDWLGLHRLRALDSHANFDNRHLGGLLERAIKVSGEIRDGRRDSSVIGLLPLLVSERVFELRPGVTGEEQKIPLLLKTMMAEAMAGACAPVVLAANVNRYVSDLFTRFGDRSNVQELLKNLDEGTLFGAFHVPTQGEYVGSNSGSELTGRYTDNGKLILEGTARFVTGAPVANELLACALVPVMDQVSSTPKPSLVGIVLRPSKDGESSAGDTRNVGMDNSPCILTVTFSAGAECEAVPLGPVGSGELALAGWRTRASLDASVMACAAASNAVRAVSLLDPRDRSASPHNSDGLDLQTRVEALRTIVCALSKWSEFEPFELGALATAGLSDEEKRNIRADTANLIPFLLPMCRRFIQSEAQSILAQSMVNEGALSQELRALVASSCEALTLSSVFDGHLESRDVPTWIEKVGAPSNETLASCFEHFRKLRDELCGVPRLTGIIDVWWKECERLETVGRNVRAHLASGASPDDPASLVEDFSRYFGAVLGAYWFIQHARTSAWTLDVGMAGQANPSSITIPEANCEIPKFYQGKIDRVRHFVEHVVPRHCSAALL